ncbi:hypothetical protein Taro_054111 [Colocasia esculenta]|uniref:Uncharacterized protein n=1 Tax=Colocasia esculenta TaxID=4460 RepID=A0A843XN15_COLES|nr:hypothetical protein [Colocasia esculenta]
MLSLSPPATRLQRRPNCSLHRPTPTTAHLLFVFGPSSSLSPQRRRAGAPNSSKTADSSSPPWPSATSPTQPAPGPVNHHQLPFAICTGCRHGWGMFSCDTGECGYQFACGGVGAQMSMDLEEGRVIFVTHRERTRGSATEITEERGRVAENITQSDIGCKVRRVEGAFDRNSMACACATLKYPARRNFSSTSSPPSRGDTPHGQILHGEPADSLRVLVASQQHDHCDFVRGRSGGGDHGREEVEGDEGEDEDLRAAFTLKAVGAAAVAGPAGEAREGRAGGDGRSPRAAAG